MNLSNLNPQKGRFPRENVLVAAKDPEKEVLHTRTKEPSRVRVIPVNWIWARPDAFAN